MMKTNTQKADKAWRRTLWGGGITVCVNLTFILVFALTTHSWSTDCGAACQEFFRDTVTVRGLRKAYNDRLVRWNKPIRIVVINEIKDSPLNLDYLFNEITYSTGHDISSYKDGKVNFIVVLTDNVFETVGKYNEFFDDLFSIYGIT